MRSEEWSAWRPSKWSYNYDSFRINLENVVCFGVCLFVFYKQKQYVFYILPILFQHLILSHYLLSGLLFAATEGPEIASLIQLERQGQSFDITSAVGFHYGMPGGARSTHRG